MSIRPLIRPAEVVILPKLRPDALHAEISSRPIRHTEAEWDAVYPHIQRMYVVERRKLRYVIDKLSREHNFKATPQTLKKRFAQWGFYKNSRAVSSRYARSDQSQSSESSESGSSSPESYWLSGPTTVSFSPEEAAGVELLMSIFDWSLSFLEDVNRLPESELGEGGVVVPQTGGLGQIYDAENLSFSFRLITALLTRGEGVLAGRLARKAFMQMESILDVEGPLFIWNLLETVWNMLQSGQTQLARMLFAHLFNLAQDRYPSQHPILRILHSLQTLIMSLTPSQAADSQLENVRRGWAVNADLLFTPPNPRLLLLFYRIVWDSDLIQLPAEGLRAADNFYVSIKEKVPAGPLAASDLERTLGHDNAIETHDHNGRTSHILGQLSSDYNSIVTQSLLDVHELCATEPDGTIHKFRALSGLLKSRMFENDASNPPNMISSAVSEGGMSQIPPEPLHARTLAFVQRVLLEAEQRKGNDSKTAVRRLRDIISLREYGQDPTRPQIVYELWQLEDLLSQTGCITEANQVRRDSFERLERYIGDIPMNSVV